MKLRTLSTVFLWASVAGVLVIAATGTYFWRSLDTRLEQIDHLNEFEARSNHLRVALQHAEQVGHDPELLGRIASEADAMADDLDEVHDYRGAIASDYLREIEELIDIAGARDETRLAQEEIQQLRLYENAAGRSVEAILDAEAERTLSTLIQGTGVFLATTVLFALAVGAAFLTVNRRIALPSRRIEAGLERLGQGHLGTRINLTGSDELAGIAGAIDRMAEHLQFQRTAIERSARHFREIARVSAGAIWEFDLETGAGWWVDADGILVDTPADGERVDLETFLARVTDEDRESLRQALKDTAENNSRWRHPYRMHRPDGTVARAEFQAMRLIDEETGQTLVIGGTRDISTQLELEEQLQQSQRLESIGQLTGGVSHDFNNLLTVILGNTEMLQESLASRPEDMELLEMIRQAAERGADLNRRLLGFARRQPLNPKVIDINKLLEDLAPMLRRALGEQVELEVVQGRNLWHSLLDPAQLESAILNLGINARDAIGDRGSLVIETTNTTLDPEYAAQHADIMPGEYVQVMVSDTGPGIPPALIDHVFEPFFTTKPAGEGTGLGLSMVYGFVKQAGGHVRVYSEPGEGTTVKLFLPRADAETTAEDSENNNLAEQLRGNETILLAEDDELVRANGLRILRSLGYTVLVAEDGPGALELLEAHPEVDLLFTDVVMPGGMTGRELVEAARSMCPELPVLYTSGYTERAIVDRGRFDRGIHFLQKPYIRRDLARKVREALDDASGDDAR